MIGPPLVVTGVAVEGLHRFGRGRLFSGPLAADDDRHAADADVDLRRTAQIGLFGGDLAAERSLYQSAAAFGSRLIRWMWSNASPLSMRLLLPDVRRTGRSPVS